MSRLDVAGPDRRRPPVALLLPLYPRLYRATFITMILLFSPSKRIGRSIFHARASSSRVRSRCWRNDSRRPTKKMAAVTPREMKATTSETRSTHENALVTRQVH